MTIKEDKKIFFAGIAGTGMAATAVLLKQAGYEISGCDEGVYPPTSEMLKELQIPILSPLSRDVIASAPQADLYVLGNRLGKAHPVVEWVLEKKAAYTSFPQVLGEKILKERQSIVVCGTHGKTTTSTLSAFVLSELGLEPGYVVGGIPINTGCSAQLGKGSLFVIEGDEYDTAFFDKGSKFFHYCPEYVILNNIEWEHVDIFPTLDHVYKAFGTFLKLVKNPKKIIANIDDPGVSALLTQLHLTDQVTTVSTTGRNPNASICLKESSLLPLGGLKLQVVMPSREVVTVETSLIGEFNAANIIQVLGLISVLQETTKWTIQMPDVIRAIARFKGVKKRQEFLGTYKGALVYTDFAHHPTAVRKIIECFRHSFPDRHLIVAFEPKNASSRRSVFMKEYQKNFALADQVLLGVCPFDSKLSSDEKMDTEVLAQGIGRKAFAVKDHKEILDWSKNNLSASDLIIFMTCGDFSGIMGELFS